MSVFRRSAPLVVTRLAVHAVEDQEHNAAHIADERNHSDPVPGSALANVMESSNRDSDRRHNCCDREGKEGDEYDGAYGSKPIVSGVQSEYRNGEQSHDEQVEQREPPEFFSAGSPIKFGISRPSECEPTKRRAFLGGLARRGWRVERVVTLRCICDGLWLSHPLRAIPESVGVFWVASAGYQPDGTCWSCMVFSASRFFSLVPSFGGTADWSLDQYRKQALLKVFLMSD